MRNFISECKAANEHFILDKRQSEHHLAFVLEKTFREPEILKTIPQEEYGTVGRAYFYLLDLMNDVDFFQSISTLGYFFASKSIEFSGSYESYIDRIFLLNLGAQSFCRTVANATNQQISSNINFQDLINLPIPVKYVLIMELCDFTILNARFKREVERLPDIMNRKRALDSFIYTGLFNKIANDKDLNSKGLELHSIVLNYLENKIITEGKVFFR